MGDVPHGSSILSSATNKAIIEVGEIVLIVSEVVGGEEGPQKIAKVPQ